jgi:cytochrome c-type biogenesis protein CcsB
MSIMRISSTKRTIPFSGAALFSLGALIATLLGTPAQAQYAQDSGEAAVVPAPVDTLGASAQAEAIKRAAGLLPPVPAEIDPHAGHNHAPGEGHDHSPSGLVQERPGFDYSAWEGLPMQEGGLEKSFLTFSRDMVKEITGNANYGGRHPIENILSMAFEPEAWANEPILKVRHPELKKLYPTAPHGRISPLQLDAKREHWGPLLASSEGKSIERELGNLYHRADIIYGNDRLEPPLPSMLDHLRMVPAGNFRGDPEIWRTPDQLRLQVKDKGPGEINLIRAFNAAREGFYRRDAQAFNQASGELAVSYAGLKIQPSWPDWKFSLSKWDTRLGLFRVAGWTYLISALVFLASYLAGRKLFALLAGSLLGAGTLLHVLALVVRGILAGRNPVSNLFESAMFIIAAMTVFCLLISIYYRTRVVGLGGATLGAFFTGMANNMPLQYGEKILPLIDALQSYWLNIHVSAMLISYALFAAAFFVALSYLARSMVLSRRPGFDAAGDETLQYLDSLNFRIITIGVPILTGGVILGAVWAAEAWGRPWAFDPKETASAITWMIYAFYLHARLFLNWRGSRGIWLSILGFAAVVFTYLGVSFFLPGLHSYVSEDGVSFTEFLKKIIPGI